MFACVLVGNQKSPLDLADLYNQPWYKYKAVWYHRLWITRPDYLPLVSTEMKQLKDLVPDDV
jgi:hypothetical protein